MRIAFADFCDWDYHALSVEQTPMGGSQSAACYLARSLAQAGHDVFLINNISIAGNYGGVTSISRKQMEQAQLRALKLDVLICISTGADGVRLRNALGTDVKLILWNHHAPDQPAVQPLWDPRIQDAFDGFTMVSEWQREQYLQCFKLDPARAAVLRNAIAPAFANVFPNNTPILSEKAWPPILAYTSTPFRGLNLLLDAFTAIRKAVPGTRLQVFSSMKVYQVDATQDQADYGELYRRCRETEGVQLVGSLPQPELVQWLRRIMVLAYPNTFAETSCIAVMEAMASGCRVVTSHLAALPETTAGFGKLIPVEQTNQAYLAQFTDQVIQLLRESSNDPTATESLLRAQVNKVNAADTWNVRAREWQDWLKALPTSSHRTAVINVALAFTAAVQHHQAGRLSDAEQLYRQILAQQPNHAGALHYLGMIAYRLGRHEMAVEMIRQALAMVPNWPDAYSNLAGVLQAMGQLDAAIAAYRQAIALKPDYPEVHYNLGIALQAKGDMDAAIVAWRQATALKPDFPEAHCMLGNALKDTGQAAQAIAAFRRAVALRPNYAEAYRSLGIALVNSGQLEQAIATLRQAIALAPDDSETHNNLGVALANRGQMEQAKTAFLQAAGIKPDYPEAHNNLGNVFKNMGQLDQAIAAYRQSIAVNPNYADAYSNLGVALKDTGQLDQAIAAYRQALALKPNFHDAYSNLLFTLHCHPSFDAMTIATEHRQWNQQHAEPLKQYIQTHRYNRNPDRRLRISYVSADLGNHPVGRFLLPLLANHDHQNVEVFAYAQVPVPDATTERLRSHTDVWRSLLGLSDTEAADLIRQDHIDILVDLAGHTGHNRLLLFARKPAPVQVTYLGYPNTTGLSTMDYRLTDAYADPPGQTEHYHTEQLFRLDPCAWCFQPSHSPPILPRQDGPITFGCFNTFAKVTEPMLRLWARILLAVPESRLLLKSAGLGSTTVRQRIQQLLGDSGINPQRLELRGREPDYRQHLALYGQMDIALDSFPYHGTTTTCEAMWMGMPTVTLAGESHVSRVGVSLLNNVGLADLVAGSEEQYLQVAVNLANDLPRLQDLRSTLRQRMEASPLMDAPRFARNVEAAYRQMWRQWITANAAEPDATWLK